MIWGCKFYFYCFFQAFTLKSKSCMCSRTRVAILLHFYSLILPDLHQQTKNHYFPWSLVGIFDSSPQRFFAFIRHHFRLNFRNKTLPVCCIRRKKTECMCEWQKKPQHTHTQKSKPWFSPASTATGTFKEVNYFSDFSKRSPVKL